MDIRLLHVTTITEWRGGDAQMYMLYQQLQALDDVDQWILCPAGSDLAARGREDGAQVVTYAKTRLKLVNAARAIVATCRRHRLGIVHAHDSTALNACLVARRFLPGLRLVFSRKRNNPLGGPLSRLKYGSRRIDGIVSVSDAAARVLDGIADPRKMRTLYGVVDVDRVAAHRRSGRLHREFGLPGDTRLVGNLAGFTPQKNLPLFLRAAALLLHDPPAGAPLHFVLVGDGPERARLEALAASLGIAAQVTFAGFRRDAASLLCELDVLMISSATEGLPTVAYEAFAAGVPVVATDAGGTREAVFQGETGFVVPLGDAEGLARHVRQVLEDPALADRLRRAAGALVRTRHTPAAFRDRYHAFYLDVLTGRLDAPPDAGLAAGQTGADGPQ